MTDFTAITNWGRVTHICIGNLTIIGSDNGLSPGRRQAIIWTNYINPGYGLSLVDTLWNASSYRQPLEQEGNPMTWIEKFWLQISLIVAKKS